MARELQSLGFDAAALVGGYAAWKAGYPVEPKGAQPRGSDPADSGDGPVIVGSGAGGK